MDHPAREHGNSANHPRSFFARLRIVGDLIRWLAGLVMPTQEDLMEADVYLGEMRD